MEKSSKFFSAKPSGESSKKSYKSPIQYEQGCSGGNNHYSRKLQDQAANRKHKNIFGNKELSFFNGDEDDDTKSSSPTLPHHPTSAKWLSKSERKQHQISSPIEANSSTDRSMRDHRRTEPVDSDHENASSTSSCSCEDHCSEGGQSDDVHGHLDYDEDSIGPEESDSSKLDKSPPKTSSAHVNPSPDLGRNSLIVGQPDTIPPEDLEDKQDTVHPRIRSVINLNHGKGTESIGVEEKTSSDKSHKSYDCLLKYFFKDACYFQIKSINYENVELSKSLGVWSTPIQNEIRLNLAFREHRNVILVFSVQQSGGFQGFARMVSESRPTTKAIPWVLPERLSYKSLGGVFEVEWLCTKELPFHQTQDLYNPFNSNKPVKVARDGQQVEPKVGKKLCRLFPRDSRTKLSSAITTMKHQVNLRKKSTHRYENFYPLFDKRGHIDERHRHGYNPMPTMSGLGDSSFPIPINSYSHHNSGYRPFVRRRIFSQPSHGPCYHQSPYMDQHWFSRQPHMARNVNDPRSQMPNAQNDFFRSQGYIPNSDNSLNFYENPCANLATSRYHPYHSSRR